MYSAVNCCIGISSPRRSATSAEPVSVENSPEITADGLQTVVISANNSMDYFFESHLNRYYSFCPSS
jgi:hypothetical protein